MTSARPPVQRSRTSRSSTTAQMRRCSPCTGARSASACDTSARLRDREERIVQARAVDLERAYGNGCVEQRADRLVGIRDAVAVAVCLELDPQPAGLALGGLDA